MLQIFIVILNSSCISKKNVISKTGQNPAGSFLYDNLLKEYLLEDVF